MKEKNNTIFIFQWPSIDAVKRSRMILLWENINQNLFLFLSLNLCLLCIRRIICEDICESVWKLSSIITVKVIQDLTWFSMIATVSLMEISVETNGLIIGSMYVKVGHSSIILSLSDIHTNIYIIIFTNLSAWAGYDTKSIFKRSLTGLNSEFSFYTLSLSVCLSLSLYWSIKVCQAINSPNYIIYRNTFEVCLDNVLRERHCF